MHEKIKRHLRKINQGFLARIFYPHFLKKKQIVESSILLESHHGEKIDGNIFYLLQELLQNPEYSKYQIYVSVTKKSRNSIKQLLHVNSGTASNKPIFINNQSIRFFRILASTKFLINDTSFTPFFVKRDDQVYLNTWHGTPLKYLGKRIEHNGALSMGNIQKNFLVSDYLLYPNRHTKEAMFDDYMLENLFRGTVLYGGYPRNAALLQNNTRTVARTQLGIDSTIKMVVYMPTWRANTESRTSMQDILQDIDVQMPANTVMYVNIHTMDGTSIDYENFNNIRPFPRTLETYAVLAASDHLVTDYSSVLFDYATTKRPITSFTYDHDLYVQQRGMYMTPQDLPFPCVETVSSLMASISHYTPPSDDSLHQFINTYCSYDSPDAAKKLCQELLTQQNTLVQFRPEEEQQKDNILIYAGNLAKNGITSSLVNLMQEVDHSRHNYFVTFAGSSINPANYSQVKQLLDKNVQLIVTTDHNVGSFWQKIVLKLFERRKLSAKKFLRHGGEDFFRRERQRTFYNLKFSNVIQFNGYEDKNILFYSTFKNHSKTHIFVHNNMVEEINLKQNQRWNVLEYAYGAYTSAIAVTDDLHDSIYEICPTATIVTVPNIIPFNRIQLLAAQPITYDEETEATVDIEHLKAVLSDQSRKKVMTIGRFSPEKAHHRLIDAFYKTWQNNTLSTLIILGGYGKLYEETVSYAASLPCREDIIIIKHLTNPYPILSQVDGFILPSLHEGFGIVIAEADILKKPVVATHIPGPSGFMKKHNGTLVDNSDQGVYEGVKQLLSGSVSVMNVNYSAYNKAAISTFEDVVLPL